MCGGAPGPLRLFRERVGGLPDFFPPRTDLAAPFLLGLALASSRLRPAGQRMHQLIRLRGLLAEFPTTIVFCIPEMLSILRRLAASEQLGEALDIIHGIEPGHPLLLQELGSMAVGLEEISAISTLAPVTLSRPEIWQCRIARCTNRWRAGAYGLAVAGYAGRQKGQSLLLM